MESELNRIIQYGTWIIERILLQYFLIVKLYSIFGNYALTFLQQCMCTPFWDCGVKRVKQNTAYQLLYSTVMQHCSLLLKKIQIESCLDTNQYLVNKSLQLATLHCTVNIIYPHSFPDSVQ